MTVSVQQSATPGYSHTELLLDAVERSEIAAVAFAAAGPVAAGFKRVVWFPGGSPYPAVSDIPEREIVPIEGRLRASGVNGDGPMSLADPRALDAIASRRKLLKLARRYRTDLRASPLRGSRARSIRDDAVRTLGIALRRCRPSGRIASRWRRIATWFSRRLS